MINFSSVKIKYIGTVVTGKTPSTKKASNFGNEYMFVTPSDLLNGYIIKSTERYLSSSGLQSISSNTIDGISVLVGCIGSDMGNVAITTEKCATNQQINAITNFKPGINPFYVYYWLLPKKKYLRQIAGCTTTPILPKTTFEEIEITIPEIHHQNKIVDILSSIDNKIELNNRIIAELEAMAKTIYDYWFVQFDFPNAEGKPYRSSGGEMVWNEQLKREIPEGWEAIKLKNIVKKTNRVYDYNKESKTYDLSIMPSNSISINDTSSSKDFETNLFAVKEGDILFGSIRPYLRKAGIASYDGAVAGTIHCYEVIKESNYNLALFTLTSENMFKYAINNSKGTKMPVITSDDLLEFMLPYNEEIAKKFNNIKIREIIIANIKQSNELASLRDFLLPLLMNGQVKFKDN